LVKVAPNKRGFLSNAAIYGIGGAASQIATAILLPLYTHYLTPADFGVLELLQRTGSIVVLLLLGHGIQMATFSFYCQVETPRERQHVFSTMTLVIGFLLLLGGVGGALLSPGLAWVLEIDDPELVTFGIAVVLLEAFIALPMALLQARVESLRYVIANLLMAVCRMVLIIGCVVWLELGIWGVLTASAVTFTIFGIGLMLREVSSGFPPPDLSIARQVIHFALPLLPSGLMGLALAGADRYFLVAYSGAREVGIYALGAKLALMIPSMAITPLWKVWTAALYDYYAAPDATLRVGRIVLRILFAQCLLALGVCIFSSELVRLLAPASYAEAAVVVPLLTIAGTLQLANNLFEGAFWSQRNTQWKPLLMACSAGVAVVAFFLFVPRWGSLGAAAALALAYAAHASLTFAVTQRIFPVHYDYRSVAATIGLAIALYVATTFTGTSYAGLAVKSALWLIWPVLLWLLGIITDEEKQWCKRQVTRGRQLAGEGYSPQLSDK
jgi:O-antigen/teichoic acid export membrane protein